MPYLGRLVDVYSLCQEPLSLLSISKSPKPLQTQFMAHPKQFSLPDMKFV